MKKFIIGLFLFFIPFEMALLTYVVLDPFMVVKHYDAFFDKKSNGGVGLNKDYISTTTFDNHYEKEKYDSFIFGNSRSVFYQVVDWQKHLDTGSKCYHFDASGESLFALHKKVKYIDAKSEYFKNALFVIDHSVLEQSIPKKDHMCITSPQLMNYKNLVDFHVEFFKAFMSYKFLYAYSDYKLSGKIKPYMEADNLISYTPCENDILTNEVRFPLNEELIANDKFYTEEKKRVFFKRDSVQKYSPQAIGKNQKDMLEEIKTIFVKRNTNYKIIINPLYDQIKLNKEDLDYLKLVFGRENVFDFSGINEYTSDYRNYYEVSHYRPHIAAEIMNRVYQKNIVLNKETENRITQ